MIPRPRTPPRLEPHDLPHQFGGSPAETAQSLKNLAVANRRFGGSRSVLAALAALEGPASAGRLRILDVGCGGADVPRALVLWARRRGLPIRVVAVERDAAVARYAVRASAGFPEIAIVRGDARELSFAAASFDYVLSSMLLHYFATDEARTVLRAWRRLATRAVVVSDVERHWFPGAAICALRRVSRSPLFDEGSRRTVLRGFTPDELRRLAADVGFQHVRVLRHFPFRVTLVGTVRSGQRAPTAPA